MHKVLLPIFLLAALTFAGCVGDESAAVRQRALTELKFNGVMNVATTPTEAEEFRGFIRIGWSADGFGIDSQTEPDLTKWTVVENGTAYTTNTGMGWTHRPLEEVGAGRNKMSTRLLLWDLRSLLQDPALQQVVEEVGMEVVYRVSGITVQHGQQLEVDLRVVARDGVIRSAHLESPNGRESPYTFSPSRDEMRFKIKAPEESLDPPAIQTGDVDAYQGHTLLIQMIKDFQTTRAGYLPETLTPDTMQLELARRGGQWPASPYDGEAMRSVALSGHFQWQRCQPQDGKLVGLGWDGLVISQTFGKGC